MKEKLKYQDVEYEIILFDDTDVIATSEVGNDGGNMDGDAWV